MGIGVAFLVFSLDQLSKWLVLNHLMIPPKTIPITSFLNIVLAWNRGISFGLLSSHHPYHVWFLTTMALGISAVLLFWIWKAETKITSLAFGLVLGGAIGNITDRLCFGAVMDFIDFYLYGYHWYTFNIADYGIVLGVGLMILDYLRESMSCPKTPKKL